MATKEEKAEVDAICVELEEKKKRLTEFQKTDSREARYRATVLEVMIRTLNQKYHNRMKEILRKDVK